MGIISSIKTWCNTPWGGFPPPPPPVRPKTSRTANTTHPQEVLSFGSEKAIVLYLPPKLNKLIWAAEMGVVPEHSNDLNHKQKADIHEKGYCSEILNFAPIADYWRQPAERALQQRLRTYLQCAFRPEQLKVTCGLRSSASECGTWFKVELLTKEEMELRLPPKTVTEIAAL